MCIRDRLVGGRAYLPAEDCVLAEFFDRYVKMAFIDYSAIKETAPRKEEDKEHSYTYRKIKQKQQLQIVNIYSRKRAPIIELIS